ncbi:hypothetical protein CPC08DRAFT_770266 [Agrocybe pediades]|nr:hypothetical protein CPC08DRAFT_770266 [Agrocybe pediades]
MSIPQELPFPVAQQKSLISANLNSTLLFQFLFGIYTGLFPATLYIYIHKENRTQSRDKIIIGNTTALYSAMALYLLSNWLYTNILFCTTGATRLNTFIESVTVDMPLGEKIVNEVTSFVVFLFADGLLVWRCFHACGQSFRRSLLPIMLFTAETVLVISATVFNCLLNKKTDLETIHNVQISDRLNAATFVAVAATSSVSTFVICLRIWRHTSQSLSSCSRKHYRTIINVLIESSATYTAAVIFLAILNFTLTGNIESSFTVLLISNFVGGGSQIIAGLAPTLMVARLFVSSSQEDTEVSTVRLPSDFISCAFHATGANTTNVGLDLEMQQSASIEVEEQENEKIQEVCRNEFYGQPKDELQGGGHTVV